MGAQKCNAVPGSVAKPCTSATGVEIQRGGWDGCRCQLFLPLHETPALYVPPQPAHVLLAKNLNLQKAIKGDFVRLADNLLFSP